MNFLKNIPCYKRGTIVYIDIFCRLYFNTFYGTPSLVQKFPTSLDSKVMKAYYLGKNKHFVKSFIE